MNVTFGVDGTLANGTLKAEVDGNTINSSDPVKYGKTVTFTAEPNADCYVDQWTIIGGVLQEGGTEESTTAKVKTTEATTVKVSFTKYKKVAYGTNGTSLDNYLKNAAPHSDGIYYIKVTGLTAVDLKGDNDSRKPSALGKILKDNPTKKVALKLEKIHGLTDMSRCFFDCKSLAQAPVIPSSVKNMECCFYNCKKITTVTLKRNYNVWGFNNTFKNCEKLTTGSIKVPAGQLEEYQAGAYTMDAQEEWFVAE